MIKSLPFLFCALLMASGPAGAEPLPAGGLPPRTLRDLVGEHQVYAIDFLFFKKLAEGELRLSEGLQPGRYRAELVARTLGVAAWLTGDRTQRYVAEMEADRSGRLRSVSYESAVLKRKGGLWNDRRKRYLFDYPGGKVHLEKGEGGNFSPVASYDLPAQRTPVDILTGFYNLRLGAYGAVVPGARLKIPTFTTRGISDIDVEVLAGPLRSAGAFFPKEGVLLRVRVDPEVFDTGGSDLYAWFDGAGRPARGIVEGVIGMGDVYGYPREEKKLP